MSTLPRISIVTPSYNQARYLEETINSILGQGYPNLEYIVIDGGSEDESADTINRYAEKIAYWVSEADKGQSDAICKGFEKCTGDIITFCNSDDIYLPNTLFDVARAYQENHDCGAIVGAFYFIDAHSQTLSEPHPPQLSVKTPYDFSLGPPGIYRLHQASAFFTRHALDTVGRFVRHDLHYTMDRELLYRVARQYPIVTRPMTYAGFRLHDQSKSVADHKPFAEEFALLYRSLKNGVPIEDRQREQMARYHLGKGYIKIAKSTPKWGQRIKAMGLAACYYPKYLSQKSYYYVWYQLLSQR